MTTKERLHKLVDELSDVEAEDAFRVIASRRAASGEITGHPSFVLDDASAQMFLDALDAPASFEPGLRRLVDRPRVLGS